MVVGGNQLGFTHPVRDDKDAALLWKITTRFKKRYRWLENRLATSRKQALSPATIDGEDGILDRVDWARNGSFAADWLRLELLWGRAKTQQPVWRKTMGRSKRSIGDHGIATQSPGLPLSQDRSAPTSDR